MNLQLALYAIGPVVGALIGAAFAVLRPPDRHTRSLVQHFAGGLVFAAVAFELLPTVPAGPATASIVGVGAGIGAMLSIRWLSRWAERRTGAGTDSPFGLAAVAAVDFGIDGLVIGIGTVLHAEAGILLAFALTLEGGFLGLAVAVAIQRTRPSGAAVVGGTVLTALPVLPGALVGAVVFADASAWATVAVLAFGAVALLYLVTEELLVEAHEVAETPVSTALFFVGFLAVLLLDHFVATG